MFWRRKREEAFERPTPPHEVTLQALGYVHNKVAKPRPHGWERVESAIAFAPEYAAMLEGLDHYSHVIVTFWMDLAPGAPEKPETMTLKSGRRYGILATRSQLRPNHLGVSAVRLLGVDGETVRVLGLDAIDGTPVLDIKPYLPEYDAHPEATIPLE
ncbi:MAG: tRNA (N6-threonylcarbamoyladenosine(37)-N6)-methyltransferase TrmO [Anaerolinea sp.]|nr:tRNA (N6-threonylcarbamoyladenosine(37)-N6)-methyltransferase TrmO [Anaerolinea sp.]